MKLPPLPVFSADYRPRFPLLFCLALFAGAGTQSVSASVVINEFVASNGSVVADEDGDFEDWIELYNTGYAPVDLEGWGLSDDPEDPFRWTFPAGTVGPGEHLVVWASGKDRRGENGANGGDGSGDGSGIDIPEGEAVAPDDLPGLVGWFKADALSGLSGDDPVAHWPDSSARGNHAIQDEEDAQPVFQPGVINGLPAVRFNGTSHQLSLPHTAFSGMETLEDFTAITLVRWDGGTTAGIIGTGPSNANAGNLHLEVTSGGGDMRIRIGAVDSIRVSALLEPGAWAMIGASQLTDGDEPAARLYHNGSIAGSRFEDPGTVDLAEYGGFFIGNSHSSSRHFDGYIAEVILFNRALPTDQRRGIEHYLFEKYDLANLPEAAPPLLPGASLHTNFRISAAGEPLLLTRSDGSRADEVGPVAVPRDAAYGRSPDGTGAWYFFADPSPGQPNLATTYSAPLEPPEFSRERGFYEEAFALTLSHADPEAEIYYSLNGSPPSETDGIRYTGPITVDTTTVVRAVAKREGALPVHHVMTHSYLFLDDVIIQPDDPAVLGFPALWGNWTAVHYGMNPEVTQDPAYAPLMREALESIPSISLVIDMDDMFDPEHGIYPNRLRKGFAWERPVSFELIHPEADQPGFQINAGVRSQGGASRRIERTPKASLRLLFKSEYEARRLEFPFFLSSGSAMDDFNTITLRAEYNNEWLHPNGIGGGDQRSRGQYVRDQFIRQSQIDMTGYGSHSNHAHLYINGVYWGLYNPSERIDAAFAANYFGGEREDWDAITHGGVRDGNRQAWDAMRAIAGGGLASMESYEAIKAYLDVPQYTDYMIVNLWAGMHDWPHNNWNAVRRREEGAGFMFFCWDSERSMEGLHDNRLSDGRDAAQFFAALRANTEYRLLFADHVHRHFFNDGALTPARTIERYGRLADRVETAVIAESARWGSYRRDKHPVTGPFGRLYTKNDFWIPERDRLLNDYLPQRTGIVLNHFRNAGLYPQTAAPAFEPHGATFIGSGGVALSAPQGTVYFTTDGTDPRVYGSGAVSPSAVAADGEVTVETDAVLKARVLHNGQWSALNEAAYTVAPLVPHPLADGPYSFSYWGPESPAGTYPDNMIFEQTSGGDPGLTEEMDGYWTLPYDLTSRSRVNGLGAQGVSFINTANAQAVDGAGYLGTARLALDATGESGVRVQWTAGTVTPNDRVYALRLQYRVGASGPFFDVPDEQGMPIEYLRHEEAGHNTAFGPVLLPQAVDGQPYVELRWKYHHVLGDSGPRAEIRLGDVIVASGEPQGAAGLVFDAHPPEWGQSGDLPSVIVRAVDAQGISDTAFTGQITLTLMGDGEMSGPATVSAVDGTAVLDGLSVDGAGEFSLSASAEGLPSAQSVPFRLVRVTELVMPRYIQGDQDADNDNNDRVPFAFRLRLEGLLPNAVYRYGNRVVTPDDPPTQNGAGNAILITGESTDWIRNTDSPRFRVGDLGSRHLTFTTDAEGAHTAWFVTEPTGNARFTPGNTVFMRLLLNDGAGGEEYFHYLTAPSPVTVIPFGPEPGGGSGVIGESSAPSRNFIVLYDNADGTGRPLAAVPVEITGSGTDDRYVAFYDEIVATKNGYWGALLPNDLSGGLRRIEERSLADGSLLGVRTEGGGFPGTVNPSGGREPLFLDELSNEADPWFIPGGSALWTVDANWTSGTYPDGAGAVARIGTASLDDRNVELGAPVTVGVLSVDNASSPFRNRIRDTGTGNGLRFDTSSGAAMLSVDGDGEGFVEFDIDAGAFLAADLAVDVMNIVGDPEYGALRLRRDWSGPGGIVKVGDGVLSLTGGGKTFTGPLTVNQGVVRVTDPAAPALASKVEVNPGGQLRLVSGGGSLHEPREYTLGAGAVLLDSAGRGGDVPVGEEEGILGALRMDPGSNDNVSVMTNGLHFAGPSSLHVDGTRNHLQIAGAMTGEHGFSKSGGGTLELLAPNGDYTAPVSLLRGRLLLQGGLGSPVTLETDTVLGGHGAAGPLSGTGEIALDGTILTVPSLSGLHYSFGFSREGSPLWENEAAAGNAVLRLTGAVPFEAPLSLFNRIDVFIARADLLPGERYRGAFFTTGDYDLESAVSNARLVVHHLDHDGEVHFGEHAYAPYSGAVSLHVVQETADFADGAADGRVVEIRIGTDAESFEEWKALMFPDPEEAADPTVSGPLADPLRSGLANLVRHAFGLGLSDPPDGRLPYLEHDDSFLRFVFPEHAFPPDVAIVVDASTNLDDWSTVVFDSRADSLQTDGLSHPFVALSPDLAPKVFLRLRVKWLPIQD
ncbi:MAG: chitobiase/beta-hexosaminidase C-terminal domain-containing protein [Opitutales bacterium]|nr:chitobiase/beta-hexosaminidase C-terminal domain-containing protein [Opitutales bacterium]